MWIFRDNLGIIYPLSLGDDSNDGHNICFNDQIWNIIPVTPSFLKYSLNCDT